MAHVPIDRRRSLRLFVRKFQLRFVLSNLAFFCLMGLAFVALLFGPLIARLLDPAIPLEEQATVADAFLAFHARIWLLVGLVALIGTARLAVESHRVAGPLLRFTRILRAVQSGDVSMRVSIRGSDYLKPEADALNGALRTLRRRMRVAQRGARRLDAALGRLGPAGSPADDAAVAEARDEIRRLRQHLDYFRTAPPRVAALPPAAPSSDAGDEGEPRPRTERRAGFTLIELLIVVAILGTIAAIAIPVYGSALDVAKVARTIADVRAMSREIEIYRITVGHPPDTLDAVGFAGHHDPYGRAYAYLRIDTLKGKGAVRKDRKLNPLNSDFDLYSLGKDGKTKQQITNKDSLDDIIRASDGGFFGVARDF